MNRDKHVDVMLAFGIIFVVMGHNYQFQWFYFPAYSFHMAFFFFISGYLFKIKTDIKEKVKFVKKKIVTQLLPYYLFNAIFFAVTALLKSKQIVLAKDFNLSTFFITPFTTGHQNAFIIPLWFLLNLFLINLIVQAIYWKTSVNYKIWISIPIFIVALLGISKGLNLYLDFRLTIVRSCFALLFFQLGILIHTFKQEIDKWLFNPLILFILWGCVTLITNFFGPITYSIVWGSVENNRFYVPVATTILIVLITYSICYYISNFVKEKNILILIGQKSFWIMALHLSVFFSVNVILYKLGCFEKDNLNQIYFHYKIEHSFVFYLVPAVAIPVIVGILFQKLKFALITKRENYYSCKNSK